MSLNRYRSCTNQILATMLQATLLRRLQLEESMAKSITEQLKKTGDFDDKSLVEELEETSEIEFKLSELTEEMKKRNCVMSLKYSNTAPLGAST